MLLLDQVLSSNIRFRFLSVTFDERKREVNRVQFKFNKNMQY